jgi:hypothetical protein
MIYLKLLDVSLSKCRQAGRDMEVSHFPAEAAASQTASSDLAHSWMHLHALQQKEGHRDPGPFTYKRTIHNPQSTPLGQTGLEHVLTNLKIC